MNITPQYRKDLEDSARKEYRSNRRFYLAIAFLLVLLELINLFDTTDLGIKTMLSVIFVIVIWIVIKNAFRYHPVIYNGNVVPCTVAYLGLSKGRVRNYFCFVEVEINGRDFYPRAHLNIITSDTMLLTNISKSGPYKLPTKGDEVFILFNPDFPNLAYMPKKQFKKSASSE